MFGWVVVLLVELVHKKELLLAMWLVEKLSLVFRDRLMIGVKGINCIVSILVNQMYSNIIQFYSNCNLSIRKGKSIEYRT